MTDTPVFWELDPVKDAALIEKLAKRCNRATQRMSRKARRDTANEFLAESTPGTGAKTINLGGGWSYRFQPGEAAE